MTERATILEHRIRDEIAWLRQWGYEKRASVLEEWLASAPESSPKREYMDGGQPGGTCACGRTPDPGIKPGGGCWCSEEVPDG